MATVQQVLAGQAADAERERDNAKPMKGKAMADMSKYTSSPFVKLEDVENGPRQGAIAKLVEGKFGKPVITLDDGSRVSLNATNVAALIRAFGRNDEDWIGQQVELYAGTLKYNGSDHPAVLVRAINPLPIAARTEPKPQPLSNALDDEIPF